MPRNPQRPKDLRDGADECPPSAQADGPAGAPPPVAFTVPGPDAVLGWAGVGVESLLPPPPDLHLGDGGEGEREGPRREPRER
jgi:hypothetical protein